MLLPGGTPRIGRADTYLSARSSDGSVAVVDGRDRPHGQVFGCGGVGGDQPTELPLATYSCTDSSEIIQYLPAFGPATPSGDGLEAVLGAQGRVQAVRPQGGPIPANGSTLVGTGGGADWLRAHAGVGSRVTVSVRSMLDGRPAPLSSGMGAVTGAHARSARQDRRRLVLASILGIHGKLPAPRGDRTLRTCTLYAEGGHP